MFFKTKDSFESKKLFRELALRLHPDHGGSHHLMILLQEAYEERLKHLDIEEEIRETSKEKPKPKPKAENKTYSGKYQNTFENVEDDDEEKLEIIKEIKAYSATHPKFNMWYIESLIEFLEENGHLTSTQYNKIVNIYYSFRMDNVKKNEKT